ncbi:MAG: hypothetical protein WBA92_14080 [Pseudorhodobacter sp.]
MFTSRRSFLSAFFAAQLMCASAAYAETGNIELELNTAKDEGQGCRLTYVATNNTSVALEKSSYEVAVYNTEGIVQRLLVLEFGWLPVGKTRVVQFDLPEQGCASISRISVNGPVECTSDQGEQDVCRDNQLLSSRVRTIQFN